MNNTFKQRLRNFTVVTHRPGTYYTAGQIARIYHRYYLAAEYAAGRVLEVGCGPGIGLRYVAAHAEQTIGGDFEAGLLKEAVQHHQAHLPFVQLDAQQLPFANGAFNLVFSFEAVYYFPDMARFVAEAYRVLKPGGTLLFNTLNNTFGNFDHELGANILSAAKLDLLLRQHGFVDLKFFGAFHLAGPLTRKEQILQGVRRLLYKIGLFPPSPRIRTLARRLNYGQTLARLTEVEPGFTDLEPNVVLDPADPAPQSLVIYIAAIRP